MERKDFSGGTVFRDENQSRFLLLYTVALWVSPDTPS